MRLEPQPTHRDVTREEWKWALSEIRRINRVVGEMDDTDHYLANHEPDQMRRAKQKGQP